MIKNVSNIFNKGVDLDEKEKSVSSRYFRRRRVRPSRSTGHHPIT